MLSIVIKPLRCIETRVNIPNPVQNIIEKSEVDDWGTYLLLRM